MKAPSQRAFAEAQLAGELVDALARVREADHSGLDRPVGQSAADSSARRRTQPPGYVSELQATAELLAGVQAEIAEADAAVSQLIGRDAERRSARTG